VAFVNDEQKVLREVVYERVWWFARLAPVKVAGVVLNALAIARFSQQLQVVTNSLLQPLRFQQLSLTTELCQLLLQLLLNGLERSFQPLTSADIVACGIDDDGILALQNLSRQRGQ
jgi:hypothetical protein